MVGPHVIGGRTGWIKSRASGPGLESVAVGDGRETHTSCVLTKMEERGSPLRLKNNILPTYRKP